MNKYFIGLLLTVLYYTHTTLGRTIDDATLCNKCTQCIISTSNLMMGFECSVTEINMKICLGFINNDLGPYICGSISELKNYIYQQCSNQVETGLLARNMAVGLCYQICK
jgi:hypothetical protein